MEEGELTVESIKNKSVRGVVVLTGRTFLLQLISLIAQLFLFAYLGQYEFGVFAIVTAVVNFLVYFSDIGLAAALIQKRDSPSEEDLKTTFLVQQVLVFTLVILLFVFSKNIVSFYKLDLKATWLMYSLGISLIITSFKSIPSVLLERKLEFVKLVFPQILEQVIYNICLVFLAIKGFGITSFTISILIRSLVGVITIYILMPWKPGFSFSTKSLKELFRFGIPYQLNTLLATFKDDGMIMVLGGILGASGVGILSFAQKVARYPLTFFMDTITKVTFPAFSRLQDEKDHLKRTVSRSIFFICLLVFPSLVGLTLLMPMVVEIIPKYNKWTAALIPIIFISINFMFAAATTQITNVLNATGKIKITFYLMIMWTALTWIIVPFLSMRYGVNGSAFGYSLVGVSSIVAIIVAKKYVDFSIIDSMVKPLVSSILMGGVLFFSMKFFPKNFYSLGILIFIGVLVYGASIISLIGASLIDDVKKSFTHLFNRAG